MKLGVDSYSTRNSGLDPVGVLRLTSELGLQGVLFELSPFESFRDADLEQIRRVADELGLYIEFGMGSILRRHPMAERGLELLADAGRDVSVSDAQIVIEHLHVAKKLGSPILRCVAGNLFTRDEGQDMVALADEVVPILSSACKAAEQMGLEIAIENHADFTVRELLAIRERVDSRALGFTVDCANLAFDLDDPIRLAELMAPWALTTHFKNYRVIRTDNGLALENCSLGCGHIDLVAIANILARHDPDLTINIEIHSQFAPFTLDVFNPDFFAKHPCTPSDGICWYLAKSWQQEIHHTLVDNLPAGALSWELELADLTSSVAWAKEQLSSLLTR